MSGISRISGIRTGARLSSQIVPLYSQFSIRSSLQPLQRLPVLALNNPEDGHAVASLARNSI